MNIREAMRAAVAERGEDYVYPFDKPGWTARNNGSSCMYAVDGDPGQPACIVGLVLAKMGALTPEVARFAGSITLLDAEGLLPTSITGQEVDALRRAQDAQDSGETWGSALTMFEEALKA